MALIPALLVAGVIALGTWLAAGGSIDAAQVARLLNAVGWSGGGSHPGSESQQPLDEAGDAAGAGMREVAGTAGTPADAADQGGDAVAADGLQGSAALSPEPFAASGFNEPSPMPESFDLKADAGRSPGEAAVDGNPAVPGAEPTSDPDVDKEPAEPESEEPTEQDDIPRAMPKYPGGLDDPLDHRAFLLDPADGTDGGENGAVPPEPEPEPEPEESGADSGVGNAVVPPAEADSAADSLLRAHLPIDPSSPTDVLMAFLRARSVDEMVAYVFDGDALLPEMRHYYRLAPLEPPGVQSVKLEVTGTIPGTRRGTHIFLVTLAGGHSFPVSVEEGDGGYRVDWEGYVQCKDRLLERFLKEKPDGARQFYASVRRTHYFGDDVQNLAGKVCFRVMSPLDGDDGIYAFAERDSPFFESMSEMMQWGGVYFPVIELEWVRDSADGSPPFVRLNRVVRESWRGK